MDPNTPPVVDPSGDADIDPNQFDTLAFWTSPSSYLTLGTYILPVLAIVFRHFNVAQATQVVAVAAPVVATAVLVIVRAIRHEQAVKAAVALKTLQLANQHDAKVKAVELLPLGEQHTYARAVLAA